MPSLLPCRIPAWLAGVVGGSIAAHGWRVDSPLRTSRPSTGTRPARIASRSTGRLSPSIWTTSRPGIGSVRVPELACHQSPDEHAVVRVVVAHRHELGEQAVEKRQEQGSPDRCRGVTHVNPRHDPSEEHDRPELRGEAQGLGDEDRQPDEQRMEDDRESAVEGQQQQACQQQRRKPVDLQTRGDAGRDREGQAGPHDRTGSCDAGSPGGSVATPTSGASGAGRRRPSRGRAGAGPLPSSGVTGPRPCRGPSTGPAAGCEPRCRGAARRDGLAEGLTRPLEPTPREAPRARTGKSVPQWIGIAIAGWIRADGLGCSPRVQVAGPEPRAPAAHRQERHVHAPGQVASWSGTGRCRRRSRRGSSHR